jgi:hypothetical protein
MNLIAGLRSSLIQPWVKYAPTSQTQYLTMETGEVSGPDYINSPHRADPLAVEVCNTAVPRRKLGRLPTPNRRRNRARESPARRCAGALASLVRAVPHRAATQHHTLIQPRVSHFGSRIP